MRTCKTLQIIVSLTPIFLTAFSRSDSDTKTAADRAPAPPSLVAGAIYFCDDIVTMAGEGGAKRGPVYLRGMASNNQ